MRQRIYLPNLNALRFIAACMVIIHHIEQLKDILNIPNTWEDPTIRLIGNLGVVLFFVLSGFLITYLLLKEREASHSISITNFYKRRVLRIWPLYYLIIVLTFFILPFFFAKQLYNDALPLPASFGTQLLLYLIMLPNVAITMGLIPYASQLWSIGVEEQFYILWPIIMKRAGQRITLLLITCLTMILIYAILPPMLHSGLWALRLRKLMGIMPFDCMAMGSLFAIMMYTPSPAMQNIKTLLFHKYTQLITLTLLLSLIARGVTLPVMHSTLYALLFAVVISNMAINPNNLVRLENRVLNESGKISYGLYMYHPLMIIVAIQILAALQLQNSISIYLLSFILTIFVAALSYRYFERPFLSLKQKFSTVISGDDAKEAGRI